MYDVAIIGAGAAGANLARLIGKNYSTLLIDKRKLDKEPGSDHHIKCCGGLIAPDAQKVLAQLGLGLPKSVLVGPQLFVVRTMDLNLSAEGYYQRFYINVDREKLDRWLVSLIHTNVDTRFGMLCKAISKAEDHYKITLVDNGREYVERARIIVGADGASSIVRKLFYGKLPFPQKYIAIQEWYEASQLLPYFSAVFDKEITDFYSWTIPKEETLIVGSALVPGPEAAKKFELLKSKLESHNIHLKRLVKKEGAWIFRPAALSQIITGNGGAVLTGEAAGFISPSSSEGLSYAFRSSIALSESLSTGLEGFEARYRHKTAGLRNNILIKNLKAPFMYNPILRGTVMKSGLLSVDVKD